MPEAIHAPEIDDQLQTAQRTYVLDTSVLLSDPGAIHRFAEHSVVIPVVVMAARYGGPRNPSWRSAPGRDSAVNGRATSLSP